MYSTAAYPPVDVDVILPRAADLKADQKKYEQTMKYFDFVALFAHGMGIIMVVLSGKLGGARFSKLTSVQFFVEPGFELTRCSPSSRVASIFNPKFQVFFSGP